ncbi:MAG: hypothetical protein E7551_08930 [Ruminococcaceae bacterium]|nr:hypothetical protein [Oscillospiraceae bacterium]
MKNNIFIKILLLCLCFALAFSVTGCSKGGENVSSNLSSEQQTSSEENISSDEPSSEVEDTTELPEEDEWLNEFPADEIPADEEDYITENVKISNAVAPVEDDFLGFNAVYHCYTYMDDADGRVYTEDQAQLEFNRLQNMGVDIVRTYYNQEFAYDKSTNTFNWESDDMKATYKWMKEMQKRNISVALNTGWSMRGAYVENYYAPWLGCYVSGDLETTAKNHANFIVESLNQFRAHGINNVKYLILFTEPDGNASDSGVNWAELKNYTLEEAYDFDPNVHRWLTCSRAIHDALVKDGTRNLYKTVGPNTAYGYESKDTDLKTTPLYYFAIKYAADIVDIFSTHRYIAISDLTSNTAPLTIEYTHTLGESIDMAHNIGKKLWYDETNISHDTFKEYLNTGTAEGLHTTSYFADSMNRGVQNLMWWYVFDQQWPNNHTYNNDQYTNGLHHCGFIPSLLESYIPQPTYYSASLLSKYFGNGAKVYKAESETDYFTVGVQQDKNNDWSICLANFETDTIYAIFEFDKNIGSRKFYRHVYNASDIKPTIEAKIIPADRIYTTSGDRMVVEIPANSSVVLTTIKD